MSEPAAKLRVKVTLHRDLPVEPMSQLKRAKTPKSKFSLILLFVALVAAGFWTWQQLNNSKTMAEQTAIDDVVASGDNTTTALAAEDAEPVAVPQQGAKPTENGIEHTNQIDNKTLNHSSVQPQLIGIDNITTVAAAQANAAPLAEQTAATNSKKPDTTRIRLPEGFSRIVLAADMEQLEPGTPVAQLVAKKDIQRLYLFTELKGYAGQQLKHRWSFNGVMQTEALLTIEDSPWRTYSEKWLLPDQLGAWRVEIIDQQQNVLYSHDFQYQ